MHKYRGRRAGISANTKFAFVKTGPPLSESLGNQQIPGFQSQDRYLLVLAAI